MKRASAAPTSPTKPAGGSGEHPAVKAYRAKLISVEDGTGGACASLDKALADYLNELKTPVPSGPPEPEETTVPEGAPEGRPPKPAPQ